MEEKGRSPTLPLLPFFPLLSKANPIRFQPSASLLNLQAASPLKIHDSVTHCPTSPSDSHRSTNQSGSWRRLLDSGDFPLKTSDFECTICFSLLCEPITIACGHSFCRACLVSCLERTKKKCPSCRSPCHIAAETQPASVLLTEIIQKLLPVEYAQRLQEAEHDRERWTHKLPLFLSSTPMFPSQPLSMHLFEPRYRLMLTRIMDSTKRFGVIASERLKPGDVGTIFEVCECEFLPDGRALVQCIGRSRFRIREYWIEDGTQGLHYAMMDELKKECEALNTTESDASLELSFLNTFTSLPLGSTLSTSSMDEDSNSFDNTTSLSITPIRHHLAFLAHKGREFLRDIIPLMPHLRTQLEKQFGPIPGGLDGSGVPALHQSTFISECAKLSFWFSSILPVPPNIKMQLLACDSTAKRMEAAVKFLGALLDDLRKRPPQASETPTQAPPQFTSFTPTSMQRPAILLSPGSVQSPAHQMTLMHAPLQVPVQSLQRVS